ncbi:MAG: AraC family transcriptional regulator, partial [Planctomycetota bacterium]
RLYLCKIEQLQVSDGDHPSKSAATFHRIRRHIEQVYLKAQTIEEIASQCEVTPVYLSRLFNRFAECGAYQYLMRLKMNHAAGLLLNDSMKVREVAEELGFNDPFQFSRAFKRVYGVPPKQLLLSARQASDGKTDDEEGSV